MSSIFDVVRESEVNDNPKNGKEGFWQVAKSIPEPKDDSFLETAKDYAKTVLKGGIEGLSRFGQMMSSEASIPKFENGKIVPPKSKQQQLEEQTRTLDELLPTDEGFTQGAIRRGLRSGPSNIALPGNALFAAGRTALGGVFGQTAEELGAPEVVQNLAEITAFLGPNVTKKLLETGKHEDIIRAGRELGLTDKQITPLIQSEWKQKWLSKLSSKYGSTKKHLSETREALGNAYNSIQESDLAKKSLTRESNEKLSQRMDKILNDIPHTVKKHISKDIEDLKKNPITGESLISFWKKINRNTSKGRQELGRLKDPLKKAIYDISPELGENFEKVNMLYTKYYPIASRLKPDLVSHIIRAGEALGLGASILGAITHGVVSPLTIFIGEQATRKLSQQMLLNPKFQQLGHKIVDSLNQGKYPVTKNLMNMLSREIGDENPEIADLMKNISEEDIKNVFFKSSKED